jgi:hypothetical protein
MLSMEVELDVRVYEQARLKKTLEDKILMLLRLIDESIGAENLDTKTQIVENPN